MTQKIVSIGIGLTTCIKFSACLEFYHLLNTKATINTAIKIVFYVIRQISKRAFTSMRQNKKQLVRIC